MEDMMMVVARGTRADGTYSVKDMYSNMTAKQVVEYLTYIKERYSNGIKTDGTEIRMIQVNGWMQMIRSIESIEEMIKTYKEVA